MTGEEIRLAALNAAVRFYQDKDSTSGMVLRMADEFEKYIVRGTR